MNDFYRDLSDGEFVTALGYDIVVHSRTIGPLKLPTGKLVACDPLEHPETEPFSLELAPGEYTARLVWAQLRDEIRVAYATIEVAPAPARRWTLATVPSEDGDDVQFGPNHAFGYSVVSSMGGFMDALTANRLIEYNELLDYDDEDEIDRLVHAQLQKRKRQSQPSWVNLSHEILGPGNMLAFTAGYGRGTYRTYVGRTHGGEVTRIVTDFEVLEMAFPSFGM